MNSICAQCSSNFEIRDEDRDFLARIAPEIGGQKFSIPPPTHCPKCRWQRRIAHRNERTLYRRKCDKTGASIVSMYPANAPFPVFHVLEWLGDSWDATDYGRDFDFSRPFFEQFKELSESVPHFSAFVNPTMDENADYTNCSSEAKNCYLITQAERNEDCYYSRGINNCKSCCDCLRVDHCELCYECINLSNCYYCLYCQDCENSSDCYFSTDLRGCKNCFGCHGLFQKEYYIYNKKVSKAEWHEKIDSLVLTQKLVEELKTQSQELRLKVPQRYARVLQCESSTGDHIRNCRDSHEVFDSRDLEHCAYCYEILNGAKYAFDFSMWGINCELLYEANGCGYNVYNVLFSNHCWNSVANLIYCDACGPGVKNCFGCFGLQQKEYCVFNKQYSKDEYEELVPKIIQHMQTTKEWGEFFPIACSSHAYNEALVGEFFPLSKEEILDYGWRWQEMEDEPGTSGSPSSSIPETIANVADDIVNQVFICQKSERPFKLIKQELRLLRQLGLPAPHTHHHQRHLARVNRRNPRELWDRRCEKCGEGIRSSYPVDRPEIVYCEKCYLETVV